MQGRAPDGTAFQISGPAEAPVLVLIHGLGLCGEIWDDLLPVLAAEYRVLRYDLFGHGNSDTAPETASLRVFSDQVAHLLQHLQIRRATLIGFSIGGMINRRFALDYPQMLEAAVILNSPHDRGEAAQKQVEMRARAARDQGAFATIDAAIQRWFTPAFLAASDKGPALVRRWRGYCDDQSYAQTAWVLANGVRELIAPQPGISVPTLVITCENDVGSTPDMSRAIAREIEGAQVQILPNYKHLGLLEAPDAYADLIRPFLAGLGPRGEVADGKA